MSRSRRKQTPRPPAPRSLKRIGQSWYESKAPLFQFCLKFCASLAVLYALTFTPACQRLVAISSLANARLASAILDRIGENTQVTGATIWSPRYAVTVLPACSAIEFLIFFGATIAAFPSRMARKIPGLLLGIPALLALNQVRILSLYYIGAHFPRSFDSVHENWWGILLIIAEVVLCMTWMEWAREKDQPAADAPA